MGNVDKLREKIQLDVNNPWSDLKGDLLSLVDEIEEEIERDYMKLPVDADGVPIRVSDEVLNKNKPTDIYKVTSIADNGYLRIYRDTARIHSSQCRLVKPRTLEDVLAEFAAEVEQDNNTIETARKYANEIRELLGGDAE